MKKDIILFWEKMGKADFKPILNMIVLLTMVIILISVSLSGLESTQQPNNSVNEQDLSWESCDNDCQFKKTVDDVKAEIKDSGILTLSKWDEVGITVGIPSALEFSPVTTADATKIGLDSTSLSLNWYFKEITDNVMGLEYEFILNEKPTTNSISVPIGAKDLIFYYQPPLDEEPHEADLACNATHCWREDHTIVLHRPENVVGSYAVYHSSKRNNEYATGKAFHIYRPLVYDSLGDKIWGVLDISNNQLKVTIDENWLDKASYPIIVDPAFGYQTKGATWGQLQDYIRGSNFTITESATAGNITAVIDTWRDNAAAKCGIYKASDSSFVQNTTEYKNFYSYDAWKTFDFVNEPSLTSGTQYVLVCWCNVQDCGFRYDSATARGWTDSEIYSVNWPNPAFFTSGDYIMSIYSNYSVSGGDSNPPVFTTSPYNKTTTNQSVEISWTTDENANYTLTIGQCPSFTGTGTYKNATSTTTHNKWVNNLKNSTNYCVNVTATDTSGNSASKNVSFATAANLVEQYVNEAEGDNAIQLGIESSKIWPAIVYNSYQLSGANLTKQFTGRFDKVALKGTKRWAINYVSSGESSITGIFNITPTLYVLQLQNQTSITITDQVGKLINSTYP